MLHRVKKKNDIHQGKWNGLGGKIEAGETPEECVKREVLEESGFVISDPRLCGFITFPAFSDQDDWYVYVFETTEFQGTEIVSNEGNLKWISDEDISDLPMWEGDHLFLNWIHEKRFFSAKFCYNEKRLVRHDVIFY